MGYELPYDKFLGIIKNKDLKDILKKLSLPNPAFFSEPKYKTGKNITINISAKTSEENIKYLEKKLKIKSKGLNLELSVAGDTVRFIKSNKRTGGSRNSLGKKLADSGELATVQSLIKEIKTPKDTGQQLFIDDVDAFNDWLPTFIHTKSAIDKIVFGNLNLYNILHDATDKTDFKKVIDKFCKKIKVPKDSWNPADIFIIKISKEKEIISELEHIVDNYNINDGLIDMFNNKIYEYYKEKLLYPISLKQLNSDKPSVDYNNEPGKIKIANYDIKIQNINCNLSEDGKEIGLFTFKNNDTKKLITMQVRGFPHSYGTAQTEITSDGTPSGGRLGKISTNIIDRIFDEYNDERIKSISFFGRSPNVFSTFDDRKSKLVYSWYKDVILHPKVNGNKISFEDFLALIDRAKSNYSIAENLCQKIQGLKMIHFFIKNESNISTIMNKMINGAKKISTDNGFFIKIY